jgi:5'-phosphate synthase pdxT subunit
VTIGVLALQGDVREHVAAFCDLGEDVTLVRRPEDLEGVDGIVLPGGESTTVSMLLDSSGLFDPLDAALAAGLPAFGTCAGMILLATEVLDGRSDQRRFGVIDLTVRRNGYGRQRASFECDLDVPGLGGPPGVPLHAVFIRAPVVEAVGGGVEVVARLPTGGGLAATGPVVDGEPTGPVVAARQGSVLATAFHPELTADRRLHRRFVEMVKERAGERRS